MTVLLTTVAINADWREPTRSSPGLCEHELLMVHWAPKVMFGHNGQADRDHGHVTTMTQTLGIQRLRTEAEAKKTFERPPPRCLVQGTVPHCSGLGMC